ncbi:hypothetical protein DL96DRAFT_506151 [Flagelloscypha sp. PMI_526]|nr:hypothetical protein DL96DRAFT_506151 [Flagelloscypha sp. PMI_526]
MSLGPAYAKLYAIVRSVGPDAFVPRAFFPGEDFSSSSIPKSTSPPESPQSTPSILDTLYDGSSTASASTSSAGDPTVQYDGTETYEDKEVDESNSPKPKSNTNSNSRFKLPGLPGMISSMAPNLDIGRLEVNFPRELTEPDTSRRSIMSLD